LVNDQPANGHGGGDIPGEKPRQNHYGLAMRLSARLVLVVDLR
jgi:hypothetical protein